MVDLPECTVPFTSTREATPGAPYSQTRIFTPGVSDHNPGVLGSVRSPAHLVSQKPSPSA